MNGENGTLYHDGRGGSVNNFLFLGETQIVGVILKLLSHNIVRVKLSTRHVPTQTIGYCCKGQLFNSRVHQYGEDLNRLI